MRWRLVPVAVVLLVAATFPRTALAQEPVPPHKDPATVSAEFEALSVFAFFGGVMDLLLGARYDDAGALLAKLRLASVPENLRFIIDRYAELLGGLSAHLEDAEAEMAKASALLQGGERELVRPHLDAADSSLEQAKRDVAALRAATDALARRLGALAAPAADPLGQAYRRLLALVDQVDALRAQYLALLEQTLLQKDADGERTPLCGRCQRGPEVGPG